MGNKNLIPTIYHTHIANELIIDINNSPENSYYMFLGNHMPINGVIPQPMDDTNDTMVSTYRNMICGKTITSQDASMMIRNIPWTANTVYDMYDDSDTTSATDSFFAIVNAGAFSHVWKCLDNNLGALSTVTPDISQIDVADTSYKTSDGYRWKYMTSATSATVLKFGTTSYFPITPNTQVIATSGAIDVVRITNTGSGYANWLLGTFSSVDVRVNGNSQIYSVTGNNISSTVNGFYTGCLVYISGGAGIGQFKNVIDYFSNANGNFIVIDSPFFTSPQNGDTYQIYPSVNIVGDGHQSLNAVARAIVNAVGNTISSIDIIQRGAGYSYITANIAANAVVNLTYPAIIRGIYGPYGGHGFNVYEELGATRVSFSISFANTEGNTIPATNQYQQIGVLKNPLFQNTVVNFTSLIGTFIGSETVYSYHARLLQNNVTIIAGSANVSVPNGVLTSQLSSGDAVVFNAFDGSAFWYSTVNVISNDTFMTISTAPTWGGTSVQLSYVANGSGTGTVSSLPGGNTVGLSAVTGSIVTNTLLIGATSGARGVVNNVSRNDTIKGFSTFISLNKIVATSVSGSFQQNEILFMGSNVGSATSTAAIHSITANSGTLTFLISNTVGQFSEDLTATVRGSNSGAVATITTLYQPEILFGSSKVLYVENISPVTRSNSTTDSINIILEF